MQPKGLLQWFSIMYESSYVHREQQQKTTYECVMSAIGKQKSPG